MLEKGSVLFGVRLLFDAGGGLEGLLLKTLEIKS